MAKDPRHGAPQAGAGHESSTHAAVSTVKTEELARDTVEPGEVATTNQGLSLGDDNNSLRAGPRGPTLLEDFHLREKITHFDHERIPERIVHARGAAAHGEFECYESLADITQASLFAEAGKKTPVFLRFSTVAGSRGSADTPRDVRGFAVKFYTDQGVWDLVGNNIPVFFIQDAIKFPDLIHAVKAEPHNEIPQAQSAHDTFWDFASLTPETAHMLMWVMSDRAIPRSFATMEGFGIHTFRFVDAKGKARFVKFHFKPVKGLHSLVWDEAQKIAGKDPDFNRRDLFEAIERGDFPAWEMGVQIVEEADEFKFDFDLLDPTKIIPEELVPVRPIGKLTLNRNPDNYFAETEQVAFHPGHIVPGIDFTNDPLLQGRLFSYIDTQLRRVGPNFAELPINRPIVPVHNNQRDGMARQTINRGRVAYFPNSLGGGCPMHKPEMVASFKSYAEKIDGVKIRARSDSFGDHFSQATLFWNSMAEWEKDHIVAAFSFELNMCDTIEIRASALANLLAPIDKELATRVAENVGLPLAEAQRMANKVELPVSAPSPKPLGKTKTLSSPALSMDKTAGYLKGRKIAVLAEPGLDRAALKAIETLKEQGVLVEIVADKGGEIETAAGKLRVDKPAPNAPSVVYDGALLPSALQGKGLALAFVSEAFKHDKPLLALGKGVELIQAASLPGLDAAHAAMQGVFVGGDEAVKGFLDALKTGRSRNRAIDAVPA
ncbi:MAG TPA: catalase [Aliidongia sp.]|nr:catalase [Aliidongia sp.]